MKDENTSRLHHAIDEAGYFKEYYSLFRADLQEAQVKEFTTLTSDEDRVRFVGSLLPPCTSVTTECDGGKDLSAALELKEKGNAEFVRGDTEKALKMYTAAILKVPFSEDSNLEIAVLLANRSATFYHLEHFDDALEDLELALSYQYPKELRYKALERQAKCFLALKKHENALAAFKLTIQALDDCKLSTEKKIKMQKNIQIMLSVLTKPTTKAGHINAFVEGQKQEHFEEILPCVSGKKNNNFPAISDKIIIKEANDVGRFAAAASDIDAGETVAVEPSYCSVLLKEHASTHCLHCFKWLSRPYPCHGCSVAVFCGQKCQEAARNSYHKYECGIAQSLHRSGASVTVLMALRILTQKNLPYFLNLKNRLQEPREMLKKYRSDDYLTVYHLVRHEHLRSPEDFLERTAMAVFLLRCLQQVGYFSKEDANVVAPEEDKLFIGGLILRHLQLMQFNAHEISELQMDSTESLDKSESIFLGGGLFPSLALYNHSCDSAVTRYFVGTTVVVKTVRPVAAGDVVPENYGPIFTTKEKHDRQKTLRSHYWFDCGCRACEEDWPVLSKMNRKILPFRCHSEGEIKCDGVIQVPQDISEFMVMCQTCRRHTNILKGLKSLQDTDAMFRQATNDTYRGNFKAGLNVYLEILRLLHEHLNPPFYDYLICQQAIRKCMLTLGNKCVL